MVAGNVSKAYREDEWRNIQKNAYYSTKRNTPIRSKHESSQSSAIRIITYQIYTTDESLAWYIKLLQKLNLNEMLELILSTVIA